MNLHLAVLALLITTVTAQAQPSEADKAAAQRIVVDAQKQVCGRLMECEKAQFRYGKIVQYQGKYLACGEVISTDSTGNDDYRVWMLLVGDSEPPILEDSLPELARQHVHIGPCAAPTGADAFGPASTEIVIPQAPALRADAGTARKQLDASRLETDNPTQSGPTGFTTSETTGFRHDDTSTGSNFDSHAKVAATVTASMLENAAKRMRAFRPKDQFDVGPRFPELVGKTFTLDILPRNGVGIHRGCVGYPEYFFDTDKSELNLTYGDSTKIDDYDFSYRYPHPMGARVAEYAFECSSHDNKPYYGSNAFGATVAVDKFTQTFIAIAMPLQGFKTVWVDWRKRMDPQQARTLVGLVRLRVHGKIREWLPGQPILCGEHIDLPTIDFPTEARLRGCLVSADVDRVDVIDKRTAQSITASSP